MPDQQDRHQRPDVVRPGDEQLHPGAELRGEHDPGRHQHAHRGLAPGRGALGQQNGEQDDQRVGHGRGHVHDVRVQPADQLDQHVLRQLGGVERDVG
jgi:hypothetical protein